MPIPEIRLKTYEKTSVDLAIDDFAKLEKPTAADLNRVKTLASVQCGIDKFRIDALTKSNKRLQKEAHDSGRMAEMMEASGDRRPALAEYCHCHAIVSGSHAEAAVVRAVLAWCKMRIDDPRNGCWLPSNTAARARMPSWLKNAIPHSRIHRKTYYNWLQDVINFSTIKELDDLIGTLKMLRMRLQSGTVRKDILIDMRLS
jgi:hypothetical protein